jgi:hypothetical protein
MGFSYYPVEQIRAIHQRKVGIGRSFDLTPGYLKRLVWLVEEMYGLPQNKTVIVALLRMISFCFELSRLNKDNKLVIFEK